MRRARWVRRQISSKPESDPESVDVDATVISVKGMRITQGRSSQSEHDAIDGGIGSPHQAVRQAQADVARGKRWVVGRRISDMGNALIRCYLQAGIMNAGLITASR